MVESLLNAKIIVTLKDYNDSLFVRCVSSTFIGETADAVIFIAIAFFGTMPLFNLLLMIIFQALFKTSYEIVIYPIIRFVINKLKAF